MKVLELFYSDTDNLEIKKLERVSLLIFVFLSAVIIIGSLILVLTVNNNMIVTSAAFAGVIGSSTGALLSALSRRAAGWELRDGTKSPVPKNNNDTKERFSHRMATFFLFRPFLGIIAGLIVYYGGDLLGLMVESQTLPSGTVLDADQTIRLAELESFKRIIFLSLLAGLFAKTLIEILKGIFKAFFGRG